MRQIQVASIAMATLLLGTFREASAQGSGRETRDDDVIHTVLKKDAIPAILNPKLVPADQAKLKSNEPVIGAVVEGEARAYSTWLLNRHEIVNDEAGGNKFAVVW